jgi:hypothetical protein
VRREEKRRGGKKKERRKKKNSFSCTQDTQKKGKKTWIFELQFKDRFWNRV